MRIFAVHSYAWIGCLSLGVSILYEHFSHSAVVNPNHELHILSKGLLSPSYVMKEIVER